MLAKRVGCLFLRHAINTTAPDALYSSRHLASVSDSNYCLQLSIGSIVVVTCAS